MLVFIYTKRYHKSNFTLLNDTTLMSLSFWFYHILAQYNFISHMLYGFNPTYQHAYISNVRLVLSYGSVGIVENVLSRCEWDFYSNMAWIGLTWQNHLSIIHHWTFFHSDSNETRLHLYRPFSFMSYNIWFHISCLRLYMSMSQNTYIILFRHCIHICYRCYCLYHDYILHVIYCRAMTLVADVICCL